MYFIRQHWRVLATVSIVIAVGKVLFLYWGWHDAALMQSAQRYEQCVKSQYHTTPSAWYAEHGEYPYYNADEGGAQK